MEIIMTHFAQKTATAAVIALMSAAPMAAFATETGSPAQSVASDPDESVAVKKVTVVNVKGKVKRNRYGFSTKPTWKKAYVRLAQGQDIDFAVVE